MEAWWGEGPSCPAQTQPETPGPACPDPPQHTRFQPTAGGAGQTLKAEPCPQGHPGPGNSCPWLPWAALHPASADYCSPIPGRRCIRSPEAGQGQGAESPASQHSKKLADLNRPGCGGPTSTWPGQVGASKPREGDGSSTGSS